MAIESDNKRGNRWHSSEDGKFVSGPNGESIGVGELTLANFGLDSDIDLDELGTIIDLAEDDLDLSDFGLDEEELSLEDFDEDDEDELQENLDEALNLTEEQYDLIYNQGRKIPFCDSFQDVIQNFDSFFPEDFVKNYFSSAKISSSYGTISLKNTRLTTGFAFDYFTRARSASTHFSGITDEEFMEKLGTMPQTIPSIKDWNVVGDREIPVNDIQAMFDVFLKTGKTAYIPVWHGLSGVQSHRDYKTVLTQYKDNVAGAADTVLIGNGCLDYACYCAFAKGYSYNYGYTTGHDGVLLRLLAPVDSNTKICLDDINTYEYNINNAPKNWRKKSDIINEYKRFLPQLKTMITQKLTNAGVSVTNIKAFLNSLDISNNSNNRSVPLAMLGYDYVYGENQLDLINPSRVMMNVEKYRADDD